MKVEKWFKSFYTKYEMRGRHMKCKQNYKKNFKENFESRGIKMKT